MAVGLTTMGRSVRLTESNSRLAGVTSWSSVSQAASAASNVVIELAITVFIGLSGLGQWTVRYAAALTVMYLVRAALGDLLLADPISDHEPNSERRSSSLLGLVLLIGIAALVVFGAVALVANDVSWLLVGLLLPGVLAQDLLRYVSFWRLEPKTAAVMDLVWLATSLGCIPVIAATRSVGASIAGWGAGALISALVGSLIAGVKPSSPRLALTWWTKNRGLGIPTFLDTALYLLGNQGLWFFIAAAAGSETLGVFRLALLLANPALLIYLAAQTILVPAITRQGVSAGHLLRYTAVAMGAGLALLFVSAVIVLPLLRAVGAITATASPSLIWLTVLYVAASAPYVITASLLRAKRHGTGFLLMRGVAAAVTLTIAVIGITHWGATAAMAGLALGTLSAAAIGVRLATQWVQPSDASA